MAGVSPGRRAALEVLRATGRGRRLDRALDEALRSLPEEERGWVHELTYGVQRLRGRLDHLLDHHLRDGIGSVSTLLLDLLRLGAYQLLYMDGVPPYAALSQTVEQARGELGGPSTGLVNGVLRSIQRTGDDPSLFPSRESDPAGWLSTWGSHPRWLVERWLTRWSTEAVERLVVQDARPPELFVRPVGVTVAEAVEGLERAGIDADPVGRGSGCVRVRGAHPEEALSAVPAIVQDPAAGLVVSYAAPTPGSLVADLCAAPGGKGLALASRASYVLAGDASPARLRLVAGTVKRLGMGGRVGVVAARAEAPPLSGADLVLLDVPCTGTGTLRRRPDSRWRLEPDEPARLAAVQRRILEGAAPAVRPGGHLVYATCTLEPEENEEQVVSFLKAHDEFRVDVAEGAVPDDFLDPEGFLRVLPQESGFDGSFAARLRRVG